MPFYNEDVDPKAVSNDILKMCNVIRERHFKVPILKKKTGKGGGPWMGGLSFDNSALNNTFSGLSYSESRPK
jgi:hypothetical protein